MKKRRMSGGRNSFFRLGDYVFDIGPTFLMMKDVLEEVFEKSGKRLEDYVETKRLDPMYRLKFADGRELYPSPDRDRMKQTMESFSPKQLQGIPEIPGKGRKKIPESLYHACLFPMES